ncbi:helix-turn-helix domain-containing protein [Alistipes sp. i18-0019-D1]|jgi:hypothetical protein
MMNDWITRSSPEYMELREKAMEALERIDHMMDTLPSCLCTETYLTANEVCTMLRLSKRSLQNYRDERMIPYTTIGGKILYPLSEIVNILKKNQIETIQ